MMKLLLFSFYTLAIAATVFAQPATIAIVPEPVQLVKTNGNFTLDQYTTIVVPAKDAELNRLAQTFAQWLAPATGFELKIVTESATGKKQIRLVTNADLSDVKNKEGYQLLVTTDSIVLTARKPAGIFYGMQTLRQLLPAAVEQKTEQSGQWLVPCVQITDYPRFAWRGLMLDVSRHFFSTTFVKSYIDAMARYKFNVLHWHLTDDQGWRIEIKAFPKLTSVGAWRVPRAGRWWTYEQPKPGEAATDGGFYSQQDIKEIVQYAAQRNIDILPEVDVPGHSLAAIAAYPYLSATGYLYPVNPGSKFYNIQDNTLNPADERVYDFLDKVFTELAALFPHPYIHIGGDECTKEFWKKSSVVQDFMRLRQIKDEHALQSYFIKRMELILKKKGKKMIGWDEILEGGLAPEATVMSWRGMDGAIEAARQGHQVVMTPSDKAYLDLYQGDPAIEPDTYSMLRLKTCYQWDPVPASVNPDLVLGGQGNLWTESVPTGRHAEYMTWPRGLALSEIFWSPGTKQKWSAFQQKLEPQFNRLSAAGINFSKAAFDVMVLTRHNEKKQLMAELSTDVVDLPIYYTLDNTNPDHFSLQYNGSPVEIPAGMYQLRAIAYLNSRPSGNLLIIGRDELEKRAKNPGE